MIWSNNNGYHIRLAVLQPVVYDQCKGVRSELKRVEGRFCRAYLSETPFRAANLAPVIGERGPIGIRRSAAIQHNKCRQSGYCSYLIRPGVSERPEIIEVFR